MSLNIDKLVVYVAHEIGHFLGLPHTTEFNGTEFDFISDTPECHINERDQNKNGVVDAHECLDAPNLMFWNKSELRQSFKFSKEQFDILKFSPIANFH